MKMARVEGALDGPKLDAIAIFTAFEGREPALGRNEGQPVGRPAFVFAIVGT